MYYTFLQIFVSALVAFFSTRWIHPYILKIAKFKNIVDNPDSRKLQRTPVPVMGGLTVIFGVISGLMCHSLFGAVTDMLPVLAVIIIIMIIGLIDDIMSLSARIRFVIEIILVLYLIHSTGCQLNDFHGLWGVHHIPGYISMPLTVIACVGIINAINLIDGVDGYSSGYSIVSCLLFSIIFYMMDNICMAVFAVVVAASLLPFFFHNVFGINSKIFIGDSGTLSLGMIFSVFVITILSSPVDIVGFDQNFGAVPFVLAVLCVPVFDTLRVMIVRMLMGNSPFRPDKTHLHHLFIELGFSHIGTTMSIIAMNFMVILLWYISYKLGMSIDLQLYVVVSLGVFITFVFYPFVKSNIRRNTRMCIFLTKVGQATQIKKYGFWKFAQQLADRSMKSEDAN